MKQKTITYSVFFIVFILIISFFVWTAVAAGNTQDKIKNTGNAIANKDNLNKNTDSTIKSAIVSTTTSTDDSDVPIVDSDAPIDDSDVTINDSDVPIEDTVLPADEVDISAQADGNRANYSGLLEDLNNSTLNLTNSTEAEIGTFEDSNNTTNSTDDISAEINTTDGMVSPMDGSKNLSLVDGSNNFFDEINNSIDDDLENNTDYPLGNETDYPLGNDTDYPADDNYSSLNNSNNPIEDINSPIEDINNSFNNDFENDTNYTLENNTDYPLGDDTDHLLGNDTDYPVDEDNNSLDDTNNPIEDINGPIDDTNTTIDDNISPDDTKPIQITVNDPSSESVCTNNVLFNFSATDKLDGNLTYTIYINDTEKSSGSIAEGENKEEEVNLEDGHYTWKITVKDGLGNKISYGPEILYISTKVPFLTLISPEDGLVNTGDPLNFSFSADPASDAQNKDKDLNYEIDIDGNDIEGMGVGTMHPKECIQTPNITNLSDGAHQWTVSINDDAGNNASETRTFYVDRKGLKVSLISPNNENFSTDPVFKFRVSGGTGLYFKYKLLVDGEEVRKTTCDGSSNKTLETGEDIFTDYSIKASVPDGLDKMWTVNITDCAGNCYEPDPYHFSLDSTGPGHVENLTARFAPGQSSWDYINISPALYVSWDKKSGEELPSTPYDVFISDSEPQTIEDMEKAKSTSETNCLIEKYGGEPLVCGKDYWVAVIARDKSGNYNKCFVAVCGPVQAYENMNIILDTGWNLKSVPKELLEPDLSPEAVFGNNSTVLYWTGRSWEVPKTIEPCKGYWVYSPEVFENNVKFKPDSSGNESDGLAGSLALAPGWHMIGPTSMQPEDWSTALASLEDSKAEYTFSNLITYSHNEGWNGLIPEPGEAFPTTEDMPVAPGGGAINESLPKPVALLQNEGLMVPGQGYWIYINEASNYTPSESDGVVDEVPIDESVEDNESIGENNTGKTTDEIGDGNVTEEETVADENITDEEVTDVVTDDSLVPEDNGAGDFNEKAASD